MSMSTYCQPTIVVQMHFPLLPSFVGNMKVTYENNNPVTELDLVLKENYKLHRVTNLYTSSIH